MTQHPIEEKTTQELAREFNELLLSLSKQTNFLILRQGIANKPVGETVERFAEIHAALSTRFKPPKVDTASLNPGVAGLLRQNPYFRILLQAHHELELLKRPVPKFFSPKRRKPR